MPCDYFQTTLTKRSGDFCWITIIHSNFLVFIFFHDCFLSITPGKPSSFPFPSLDTLCNKVNHWDCVPTVIHKNWRTLWRRHISQEAFLLQNKERTASERVKYTLTLWYWIFYHYLYLQFHDVFKWKNIKLITAVKGQFYSNNIGWNNGRRNREPPKGRQWGEISISIEIYHGK